MATIGTYNGASILVFPAKPSPRQVKLAENNTVAVQRSPFTGSTQVQAWPGADFWSADVTLPRLNLDQAAWWSAFLAECRGMTNCFLFSDPKRSKPRGKPKGAPVVSGVNAAMATALNTRGWQANCSGLLLPGDYIQIGATPSNAAQPGLCRYHRVLEPVSSDANGNATLNIWPSIREATADGEALVLKNPKGIFRLSQNTTSMLTDETLLSGVDFSVVEAR